MKSNASQQRLSRSRSHRRGVVLMAVIIAASVCLVFFGIWARAIVREHRRMSNQQYHLQATRLAEAGLQRAIALHAADPEYRGETWVVAASQLDKSHNGQVQLRVVPGDDAHLFLYEAIAAFPADETRRTQITKSISLPNSKLADKP